MTHEAALALATPPRVAVPNVVREKIPTAAAVGDLETATAQTVEKMCEYIDAGTRDPVVRDWAERAVNCYGRGLADSAARAWAVFWLVKHAVEYAHDEPRLSRIGEPGALDLLIAPAVLVRMRKPKEDCDGFTMLLCALLRILLVECYIVTVAADPKDPSRWSHVFALAKLDDGTLMPLDCSHGAFPGWMVPAEHIFRWQAWGLNGRPADGVKMPRFRGLHGYTRPGSRMRRRGMGDCTDPNPDTGQCPDGSTYTGMMAVASLPVSVPPLILPSTVPAPAPVSANSNSLDALLAGIVNSGTTLAKTVLTPPSYQSTYNPATGQYSTTMYGGASAAGLPLGSLGTISPTILLIGGAALLAIMVFSSRGK